MIEKISAINSVTGNLAPPVQQLNYDIHNISPNEMDALSLYLFNKGEISLKERLAFVPLDTRPLSQTLGEEVHLQYYSRVWENPDRKRDMLSEFKHVLQEEIRGNVGKQNIDFTRRAIAVLERLEQRPVFEDILKNTLTK